MSKLYDHLPPLGPTPSSPSSEPPKPPKPKKPSAKINAMIMRLGLRYRPNNREDIDVHSERLDLLASDLADLPPEALQRAIDRWVLAHPFMPKASELAALAQEDELARPGAGGWVPLEEQAARRNANLKAAGNKRIRWLIEDGHWRSVDYFESLEWQSDADSVAELARYRAARSAWQNRTGD